MNLGQDETMSEKLWDKTMSEQIWEETKQEGMNLK